VSQKSNILKTIAHISTCGQPPLTEFTQMFAIHILTYLPILVHLS